MKHAKAVIGASFGDEGKGLITDYLCRQAQERPIVVRYNGGAQAGHTVVTASGQRHVFHHIGSGALAGVDTFLGRNFLVNPTAFLEEFVELGTVSLNATTPKIYVWPGCAVTTIYDMFINQKLEESRSNRHGSCGMGVHETMLRHHNDHIVPLRALDLTRSSLEKMIDNVRNYALMRLADLELNTEENKAWILDDNIFKVFIEECKAFVELVELSGSYTLQNREIIFEGAQGLLLDEKNERFFPHVTHSRTGLTNILFMCHRLGIESLDVVYVARSYLTRHGNGPLPGEDPKLSFPDETNQPNDWQGTLRFAQQSNELLTEAIWGDLAKNDRNDIDIKPCLAITHLDQHKFKAEVENIPVLYESYSPTAQGVWKIPQGKIINLEVQTS